MVFKNNLYCVWKVTRYSFIKSVMCIESCISINFLDKFSNPPIKLNKKCGHQSALKNTKNKELNSPTKESIFNNDQTTF